jgi:hypothetical protein
MVLILSSSSGFPFSKSLPDPDTNFMPFTFRSCPPHFLRMSRGRSPIPAMLHPHAGQLQQDHCISASFWHHAQQLLHFQIMWTHLPPEACHQTDKSTQPAHQGRGRWGHGLDNFKQRGSYHANLIIKTLGAKKLKVHSGKKAGRTGLLEIA